MTLQTALLQGTVILEKADIGVPRLTAEVLLSHAMRCDRSYLYAHASDELTELAWIHYGRYLNERLSGKPTQYITHRQEFFGRDFFVDERVLIPRPETEHLVEAALTWLADRPKATILDAGTGSGAIAVSISLESHRETFASDVSAEALAVAQRNSCTHNAQVHLFAADLLSSVKPGSVDLLVSNPPYVPGEDAANMQREVREWEPHVALFAGNTGLEIYRWLIAQAKLAVRPGGKLLMELGYRSLDAVREILGDSWLEIEVISDLAGLPRVIGATRG